MKWTLPYSLYPLLLSFRIIAFCLMFFLRYLYHSSCIAHHTPPVVFPPHHEAEHLSHVALVLVEENVSFTR
ncbi:hypothetical protein M441DRAFT_77315 [Trichoderma asperellum CBS 433.97]|uniref:Uncharacterized protein n=1 Tax=Trichoderma asperellum (strain ATCC 204424 / CBS 433.97 / NBRC 101777) TaxID=1042311 RepID=A0A2T3ZHC3_TRIA4|nr:hypothetical protein M441DRAFT_77315 [Trichoderma asperellum CBS 433.97]PTB44201.1 hypothetical protein M441DRAFT_77315 [Trichoderma asperellum CBS 433.97]